MMPDIKVFIGGKSFSISCGPGEESDVSESAQLLDKEAEIIQEQVGRLPEDKMLLLSGLLLADKLRTLKFEKADLENRLSEKIEETDKAAVKTEQADSESTIDKKLEEVEIASLNRISDMLDSLINSLDLTSEPDKKDTIASFEEVQKSLL